MMDLLVLHPYRYASVLPNDMYVGKITDSAPYANGNWVEKWVLQSEGVCGVSVTLHFPPVSPDALDDAREGGVHPASPQRKVIVLLVADDLSDIGPPSGPPLAYTLVTEGIGAGYAVALVSLCGFGEMGGDITKVLSTWTNNISETPQQFAVFNGRSMPGFHAGEVTRTLAWLANRQDISGVAALLAADNIHPAALISAIGDGHADGGADGVAAEKVPSTAVANLPLLCIVGGLARYQDLANEKYYWVRCV